MSRADAHDRSFADIISARRQDWRCGPAVYQVFVDRFAPPPPEALDAKRHLYAEPRRLRDWSDLPTRGEKHAGAGLWSHELDFWGGNLASLRTRLDHIHDLGADVLYLNPIHPAHTNHKYDASDYFGVSPEYGTVEDVRALASDLHERRMHLVLDGVFNHMGATSPAFIEAQQDEYSAWRGWFEFDDALPGGYRAWFNVANLPEVNLESPQVRARVWGDEDSVVRGWLRDGVDGWRLDVAYDIGPVLLEELVESARRTKPDAWIVGETWNYPDRWTPPLDGAMNFHAREILLAMSEGRLTGARAAVLLDTMYADLGMEQALRSWLILDNHDTDRLATWAKNTRMRSLLVVLHLTLPGAPVIYYGSEVGMEGKGDPGCRAPMRWDLVAENNQTLDHWRRLLSLRREHPALRWGDFVRIDAQSMLAFARVTDRVGETVVVLANPSAKRVTETVALPLGKVMSGDLRNLFGEGPPVHVRAGVMAVTLDPWSARVVTVSTAPGEGGYTPYDRVH